MKKITKIVNELQELTNRVFKALDPFESPLVGECLIIHGQRGIYSRYSVGFSIPCNDSQGRIFWHYKTYDVLVREKGGHNYKFRYKIIVGEKDVFQGKADTNPHVGNGVWRFEDMLKKDCDALYTRETEVCFK